LLGGRVRNARPSGRAGRATRSRERWPRSSDGGRRTEQRSGNRNRTGSLRAAGAVAVTAGQQREGDEGPLRRAGRTDHEQPRRADDRVTRAPETHPPSTGHVEQSTRSRGEQGTRTPWACVAETGHGVRGGSSVKVVGNGAGGASRAWNPVTRRGVGGLEQSSTSQAMQRYSSTHRLGLVGSRIPRIERVGGATNPRGGGGLTTDGVRAPDGGRSQELRTRSSRVSERPRAASQRTGQPDRRPLSGTRRRPG
jgi:hypothetical protein